MKFTTYSGTAYEIKDIEEHMEGKLPHFTGSLARFADKAIYNIGQSNDGSAFKNDKDFHVVIFFKKPEVGERFNYIHPIWDSAISSQVQKVEE